MTRFSLYLSLLLVTLLTSCSLADLPPEPVVGNAAPDFRLETPEGESVRLRDLRGMPVVLNFWATWCGPCVREMPLLDATAAAYGDDLAVLAVDFDETAIVVSQFAERFGIVNLPLLLDEDGEVNLAYQVRGYPTTFFIDAEGTIQAIHIGELLEDDLAGYLADLGVTAP